MKYTEKNGYKISEMTLGTVQLGMNYGINNSHGLPTQDEANSVLKAAEDAGIVSFDTAQAYGTSEDVLGNYFSQSNSSPTIITKFLPGDVPDDKLFDDLAQKCLLSAKKLGVSSLPFVMLHREDCLIKHGKKLTAALKKLKQEGFVKNIGVSFSEKSRMAELCDPDIFDCIQIPLNLFDNLEIRNGAVKKISDSGIAVFVRSIYLQGLFFMDTEKLPTKLSSAKESLLKIHALAESENISRAKLALSFVRQSAGIDSVVLGCETASQVKENATLFSGYTLPEEVHNKILEISEEVQPIVIRPWEW